MSFDQLLRLAQTLQLSPTLLQSMKILQMNTQELSDYLSELALENPAMEYEEHRPEELSWEDFASRVPWLADAPGLGEPPAELGQVSGESDSLGLFLRDQLERRGLPPPLLALCRYLADNLGPKGRLEQADLDDLARAGVPAELLDRAVETLQGLEPPGIAARDLRECLVLQLRRQPGDQTLALRLCDHLDALAGGSLRGLAARLGVSVEALREAVRTIQRLDPDPVGEWTPAEPVSSLRPDAWVAEVDGALRVFVNQWDLPRFSISGTYQQMARTSEEEAAVTYLREKLRQAQWVLRCVQRRQTTLETCLTALVQRQAAFFLGQAETPAPLLRRELAEQLGVHPSTVTRTLSHKALQCRQGLFPTAYFFSRRTGGEQSEQAVKARVAGMIRQEDPAHPLSDQAIAAALAEEGICLARRTVAKYRQGMGLPPSHRRKK